MELFLYIGLDLNTTYIHINIWSVRTMDNREVTCSTSIIKNYSTGPLGVLFPSWRGEGTQTVWFVGLAWDLVTEIYQFWYQLSWSMASFPCHKV